MRGAEEDPCLGWTVCTLDSRSLAVSRALGLFDAGVDLTGAVSRVEMRASSGAARCSCSETVSRSNSARIPAILCDLFSLSPSSEPGACDRSETGATGKAQTSRCSPSAEESRSCPAAALLFPGQTVAGPSNWPISLEAVFIPRPRRFRCSLSFPIPEPGRT